jgi:hypothetical protein
MGLRLRLAIKQLFPFILFRSLRQLAFWVVTITACAAIASMFVHGGELQAAIIGGIVGSLFVWIAMLPYELCIEAPDTRACLTRICVYLARSNFTFVGEANSALPGVGEWTLNRPWWRKWKGNDVAVSVNGTTIVVRGPRSMIKPLWRNFSGPWRKFHDPA